MNLKTTYLGLELEHPIIASSSPISKSLDGIKRMAEGGASAIVLFSLFEEQIRAEQVALEYLIGSTAYASVESLSYFPEMSDYEVGPGDYLELIHQASKAVDIPIIASLNGISDVGWKAYAKDMIDAGAKALELNLYFLPVDIHVTGHDVEQQYESVVRHVRSAIDAPIAVKLSPFFSSVGHMAKRLVDAGANGIVMFNRFYQPDFDLDRLAVESKLELSHSAEIRLPLLWLSTLFGNINASLAATRGVETEKEVVKYIMAGADAVMTTSAILRHGESYFGTLRANLSNWMESNGYESVDQMKGSMSLANCAEPEAIVRANYIKMLQSYAKPKSETGH